MHGRKKLQCVFLALGCILYFKYDEYHAFIDVWVNLLYFSELYQSKRFFFLNKSMRNL